MLKTVLFDMGNTLLNYHAGAISDEELDHQGLVAMAERLVSWKCKVTFDDLQSGFYLPWVACFSQRKEKNNEFDVMDFLETIPALRKPSASQIKILLLDFHTPCSHVAICDEGTEDTLRKLKKLNLKLGMISNTPLPGYCHDRTLERLGLLSLLDFRLYSYDEGIRKPHPSIFLKALDNAVSTVETTVMVGDSWELDLLPASRLGIRVIHYQSSRGEKSKELRIGDGLGLGRISTIPEALSIISDMM